MSARPLNLQLVIEILTYAIQHKLPVTEPELNPNRAEKDKEQIKQHFEVLSDFNVVELAGAGVVKSLTHIGDRLAVIFKNEEVVDQLKNQFGQEVGGSQLTTILSVGSKILADLTKHERKKAVQKKVKQKKSISFREAKEQLLKHARAQIPNDLRAVIRIPTRLGQKHLHIQNTDHEMVRRIAKWRFDGKVSVRVDLNNDLPGMQPISFFELSAPDDEQLASLMDGQNLENYLKDQTDRISNNIEIVLGHEKSEIAKLIDLYKEEIAEELKEQTIEAIRDEPKPDSSQKEGPELNEGTLEALDESFFEEDLKEVQKTQEGFLNELQGQSARQGFAKQLGKEKPDLPPTPREIITNPLQRVPLTSDSAHKGKDLLGFEQDVEAFAAIMALEKLTPPLAIALFGQWGTGKSFFMQKLSEKVEELAKYQGFLKKEEDEEDETQTQETDEKPFCEGICQIHFNAWSYMDTNLWASLVTQIFEKLDDYINDNRSEAEKEKDTIKSGIAEQLDVAKGQIAELEARKAQVQNAIDTLTEQVGIAQEELEGKIEEIKTSSRKEAITTAIKDSKIEESLRTMLDKAGITQERLDQVNPDLILKELKSGQTFVRQFLNYSGWDWALVGVGLVLLLITTLVIPKIPDIDTDWLQGIGSGLAVLTGMLSKVRGTASKLSPLVNGVLKIKSDYDTAVSEAIAKHEQEILAKQIEADQKEVELNQLNLQLKAKEAEIKEMAYKPDSVLAQKAMYNFITRKAASNDYSRHLGIISMIRKDFQTLSELFVESTKAKKVPKKSEKKYAEFKEIRDGFKKPLQRIVLYIDDLDRCPEERVVEVLEAVNLLMAFPLFVVVVGVDPRWVKNALIKKYHLQFTGHIKGSQQEVDSLGMEVINPSDYLEKIFQIPFHLKAPEDQSIKDMITHLLGDAVVEKTKEPQEPRQKTETPESAEPSNLDQDAFVAEKTRGIRDLIDEIDDYESYKKAPMSLSIDKSVRDIPALTQTDEEQTADEADTDIPEGLKVVTPASLTLHWEEGEYMRNLSWLIGNTPRTVKRFVNMYRIIRAHEGLSYEDDESKKDLLCIMFLLALQTGPFKEYESRIKEELPNHDFEDLTFHDLLKKSGPTVIHFAEAKDELPDYGYITFLNRLRKSIELETIMTIQSFEIYRYGQFIERFRFQPVSFRRDTYVDDPYPDDDVPED